MQAQGVAAPEAPGAGAARTGVSWNVVSTRDRDHESVREPCGNGPRAGPTSPVEVGNTGARRKRRAAAVIIRIWRATRCWVGRSRLRRLCPPRLVEWLRFHLLDRVELCLLRDGMRADDVLEVLDALDARDARAWLMGGWGVEALIGEVTRRHGDVDLVIPAWAAGEARAQERAAAEALAELGYSPVGTGPPSPGLAHRTTFRDAAGRTVEMQNYLAPKTARAN